MTMHSLEQLNDQAIDVVQMPSHPGESIDQRYFLADVSLKQLEDSLEQCFRAAYPEESGIVAFSVNTWSPYADIARTIETRTFEGYDSSVAMRPYEDNSRFVFTFNLDEAVNQKGSKIAHIKRLVLARDNSPLLGEFLGTGLEVVDDRLNADIEDEQCTLLEIADAHGIRDFSQCMNVTSNMSTEGVVASLDKPYSLISYKAVFEIGFEAGVTHLFAYMNKAAMKSLGKLGVKYDLLAGREFHLPIPSSPGEYDQEYVAVCMPYDEQNIAAFTTLDSKYPMRKLIAEREVKIYEV